MDDYPSLPFPFIDVGPVRWDSDGVLVRSAKSVHHGDERFWVAYSPANDPSKMWRLRRGYNILKKIHANGVVHGFVLPRFWHRSPMAILTQFNNDRPAEPDSPMLIGTLDRFLDFAIKVTSRLEVLHSKSIRHGSLYPSNIKVSDDGDVWLYDHTYAFFDGDRDIECRMDQGYLHNLPPEWTGRINRRVDHRSDFYALGATFYHIIIGEYLWAETEDELEILTKHFYEVPPSTNFHPAVDDVIAKLLNKMPEDRYQTCDGLLSDWRDIQRDPYAPFSPGLADRVSRLTMPQHLYGRDKDVSLLYDLYKRTREALQPMLVFLKGPPGVGKTALVSEIRSKIRSDRKTIFVEGKFDPTSNVPCSAIVQALTALARYILTEPISGFEFWRKEILKTLDDDIYELIPLIPEIAKIFEEEFSQHP